MNDNKIDNVKCDIKGLFKSEIKDVEFDAVKFKTKNGLIECYLRDGLLHVTAHDSLNIFPSATNCINVGVKK